MKKLAWLALIIFIFLVVFITLGATNYMGIGDTIGTTLHESFLNPARNYIVNTWLFIGTSGWYILGAIVGIGLIWVPVWAIVIKGLFWNKLIQQKILHRDPQGASNGGFQNAPSNVIPITGMQSTPTTYAQGYNQPQPIPTQEVKKEGQ